MEPPTVNYFLKRALLLPTSDKKYQNSWSEHKKSKVERTFYISVLRGGKRSK